MLYIIYIHMNSREIIPWQQIEEENEFLAGIFCHAKCRHLSENDKFRVEKAFEIACRAHVDQERMSGDPYMDHISEVLWDYLCIAKESHVEWDDLIVAILHDVLEDHPEYAELIMDEFGYAIFSRLVSISKPSPNVIQSINEERISQILSNGAYGFLCGTAFHSYLQAFQVGITLPTHYHLYVHLFSLQWWMQGNLKNYYFLWGIALLPERDFEIKCADRTSNLKHLKAVSKKYIEKNLLSTEVYIMKAQALGRYDLVARLKMGLEALETRYGEFQDSKTLS